MKNRVIKSVSVALLPIISYLCLGPLEIYYGKENDLRERTVYMRANDETKPDVAGSTWNSYYGFTYTGNKSTLNEIISRGEFAWKPATKWENTP